MTKFRCEAGEGLASLKEDHLEKRELYTPIWMIIVFFIMVFIIGFVSGIFSIVHSPWRTTVDPPKMRPYNPYDGTSKQ